MVGTSVGGEVGRGFSIDRDLLGQKVLSTLLEEACREDVYSSKKRNISIVKYQFNRIQIIMD